MISVPRRSASSTIAGPALRARTRRSSTRIPYESPIAIASSSSSFAASSSSARSSSSGRPSGTSSTLSATIRAPRSAARLQATSSASSDGWPGDDGHEQAPVLERERRAERGRRLDGLDERRLHEAAAVDDVEDEPGERSSRGRPSAWSGSAQTMTRNEAPGGEAAEDREERPLDVPPSMRFGRAAVERLGRALLLHPQPDERGVRDRERERRPERVERADEVHVAGQDDQDRRDPGEEDERQHRRLEASGAAAGTPPGSAGSSPSST